MGTACHTTGMYLATISFKKVFLQKKSLVILTIVLLAIGSYFLFFRTVVVNPVTEGLQMKQLAEAQEYYAISSFVSDGCSGSVSRGWSVAVEELSKVSSRFDGLYADTKNIPFEYACIAHDESYHTGEGGYAGRLLADHALRSEIISYGIANAEKIKDRTGLRTDEEAMFLYEVVAETVYRAVRLGGTPCTGTPYAWGFGYNNGVCTQ
jgi:hypothetical protein